MDVLTTKILRVALVRYDEIPLTKLILRPNLERLAKFFEFNTTETGQSSVGESVILFKQGLHVSNGNECPVNRLVLEERRLVFEVDGSSEDADAFYADLVEFLAQFAERTEEGYLEPILVADESEIVTRLGFHVERLYSPSFLQFVNSSVVNAASSNITEAFVKPASLAFNVEYLVKDNVLNDYRIGLSRKSFTVEPRKGRPLADQVYFSKAPFDTRTHIRLLEELERTIQETAM